MLIQNPRWAKARKGLDGISAGARRRQFPGLVHSFASRTLSLLILVVV